MFGVDSDTPIYNQLMRERESTPIFDQLAEKYNFTEKPPLEEKPMNEWQRQVNTFRDAMDLPVPETPRTLSPAEAEMHIRMIRDEFEKEFVPAFLNQDLVEMYDAGIDVLVYVIGALSNAGFDIDPGFKEIMRSNMSKMDPETGKAIKAGPNDPSGEPEGKVLKGPNYSPPNLHPIINAQHNYGAEDDTVYRVSHLPLTFGEGGPVIGEASLRMDHNGLVAISGQIDDLEMLPQVGGISIVEPRVSMTHYRAYDPPLTFHPPYDH